MFSLLASWAVGATLARADADLSAPDQPAAAALAATSGERVRVEEATGDTYAAYIEPDGSSTVDLGAGPLFVPRGTSWAPVDLDLVPLAGALRPQVAAAGLAFSDGQDAELAYVADDSGRGIDLDWSAPLPTPVVNGNTATYRNVLPYTDLVVEALADGFEQRLVVRERPLSPMVVRFPVQAVGNVHIELSSGDELSVETPLGVDIVGADAPEMWDAGVGINQDVSPVSASLVGTPQGEAVELRPDPAFMANPATTYPVVIDPSPNLGLGINTYVTSNNAAKVTSQLRTGKGTDGAQRETYIQFLHSWQQSGGVEDFLRGKYIYSATLSLYQTGAASTTATPISVRRVTSSWSETTQWSGKPSVGLEIWGRTSSSSAQNGQTISIRENATDVRRTLGKLLSAWVDYDEDRATPGLPEAAWRGWHNYGIAVLAENQSDPAQAKVFDSGRAPNPPRLSVHYHASPSTLAGLSGIGMSSDVPQLSVPYADPDSVAADVEFQVFAGSQCVGEALYLRRDLDVASGTTATIEAQLPDGTYAWRVRATQTLVQTNLAQPNTPATQAYNYSSPWSACRVDVVDRVETMTGVREVEPLVQETVDTRSPVLASTIENADVDSGYVRFTPHTVDSSGVWAVAGSPGVLLGTADVIGEVSEARGGSSAFLPGVRYGLLAETLNEDGVVTGRLRYTFRISATATSPAISAPTPAVEDWDMTDAEILADVDLTAAYAAMIDADELESGVSLEGQSFGVRRVAYAARRDITCSRTILQRYSDAHEANITQLVEGLVHAYGYHRSDIFLVRRYTRLTLHTGCVGYADLYAIDRSNRVIHVWEIKSKGVWCRRVGDHSRRSAAVQLMRYRDALARQYGSSWIVKYGFPVTPGRIGTSGSELVTDPLRPLLTGRVEVPSPSWCRSSFESVRSSSGGIQPVRDGGNISIGLFSTGMFPSAPQTTPEGIELYWRHRRPRDPRKVQVEQEAVARSYAGAKRLQEEGVQEVNDFDYIFPGGIARGALRRVAWWGAQEIPGVTKWTIRWVGQKIPKSVRLG